MTNVVRIIPRYPFHEPFLGPQTPKLIDFSFCRGILRLNEKATHNLEINFWMLYAHHRHLTYEFLKKPILINSS